MKPLSVYPATLLLCNQFQAKKMCMVLACSCHLLPLSCSYIFLFFQMACKENQASKQPVHQSLQMSIPNQKESRRAPPPNNNILLTQTAPPASAQPVPAPLEHTGKESVAEVIMVVAIVLFILGFLSLYTRQCADRRTRIRGGGGTGRRPS